MPTGPLGPEGPIPIRFLAAATFIYWLTPESCTTILVSDSVGFNNCGRNVTSGLVAILITC